MQKKIKIFSTVIMVMIFMYGELFSQINTNSPYSRFGLGDIENQALGRSIAMGGTAAGIRLPFEINIIKMGTRKIRKRDKALSVSIT